MMNYLSWKQYALLLRSRSLLTFDDVAAEFAGKHVALVGNARSLAQKQLGSRIDQCDLVVRFNRCPLVGAPSHGNRTDWIALSTRMSKRLYQDLGARGVLWFTPQQRKMPAWLTLEKKLYINPPHFARQIMPSQEDRPSTGLMMIDMLTRLDAAKVTLFGFDFFKSNSLSNDSPVQSTPHKFPTEEEIVRRLIQNDERFSLCEE